MIKEEDIRNDALEAEKELDGEEDVRRGKRIGVYLLAVAMGLLMLIFLIPVYNLSVNPNPTHVDEMEFDGSYNESQRISSIYDMKLRPVSGIIRNAVVKIISEAECYGSRECYAKALYRYVRDYYSYVSDPQYQYVQSPQETLLSGGGDCEDLALLLGEMLSAVGIHNRIVIVPGHAYNEVWIIEEDKHSSDIEWVPLDATCKNCEYGEIPREYQNKDYINLY